MPPKPVVRIRHLNFFDGFGDDRCRSHVLMDLCDEFDFVFSGPPDVVLVNCYGQQAMPPCRAIKVGYYTENLAPDLVNFDYFFGCEYSDVVRDPKYCRRVYGPLPNDLFAGCADADLALRQKTEFCNFIYTSHVPFRERFFKELEHYHPILAPGVSMHNCSGLSPRESKDWQRDKLDYLRKFKFTIAFENSRRTGYATEKLYDALRADTVPIYWGDPCVDRVANPAALVIVKSDWENDLLPWLSMPERRVPYRPYLREPSLLNKTFGRTNDVLRWLRAHLPYRRGFGAAIDEIVALDRDDAAYKRKLSAPKLNTGIVEMRRQYFDFWRKILRQAVSPRPNA
jgi:alpha(1,3/1,4) fucosyltransferase